MSWTLSHVYVMFRVILLFYFVLVWVDSLVVLLILVRTPTPET